MKKLLLISLGCAKNAVDSETILSFFKRNNFEIVLNVKDADVIVINTCGFILPSKQESIDTIIKYI
jgi:ribosomal protein S12 methylthiotransferase